MILSDRDRGARHGSGRDAPSERGCVSRRPRLAGARRAMGVGAMSGPPCMGIEACTAPRGARAKGVWGPCRAPHENGRTGGLVRQGRERRLARGATDARRGRSDVGGDAPRARRAAGEMPPTTDASPSRRPRSTRDAGCRPDYLPVVLAAAECACDPRSTARRGDLHALLGRR